MLFLWQGRGGHSLLLTLGAGIFLALLLINHLESKLRPIVSDAAQLQVQNQIITALEHQITQKLTDHSAFLTVQRGEDGQITSLTTNTAALNLLRADLVSEALVILESMERMEVQIPLGNLFGSEFVWARGPSVQVRSMVHGTVSAQFESDFSSAGVNQTLHRIWLDLKLPILLYLPGGPEDVTVHTRLIVAETVIVGQIPNVVLPYSTQSLPS